MKWKRKGHEIDSIAKELGLNSCKPIKYYLFGAGLYGRELLQILRVYECEVTFIDNDSEKQEGKVDGAKVISLNHYLEERDGIIVITASSANSLEIAKQLEAEGLVQGRDFWLYHEFENDIFPIISVFCYGKSYVSLAQITLTERCTLKCKKCAHGCFAVDNKKAVDMTLQQVYESADSFFSKIDYVKEFVLIGGEPLLYRELKQAIQYIGEKYRKQIGIYSITTNGTIVPGEDVLEACKKYDVLFRISNYSGQIPRLKNAYKRLTETLDQRGAAYILGNEESEWKDYGLDYLDRKASEEELIEVFDACRTPCREIRGNKFYYCVMARSVSDNLGYHVGEGDYLDMDKLEGENYKKELLEFTLGYSEKGYLDMCNHCNGAEARKYPIPAAEQV